MLGILKQSITHSVNAGLKIKPAKQIHLLPFGIDYELEIFEQSFMHVADEEFKIYPFLQTH